MLTLTSRSQNDIFLEEKKGVKSHRLFKQFCSGGGGGVCVCAAFQKEHINSHHLISISLIRSVSIAKDHLRERMLRK